VSPTRLLIASGSDSGYFPLLRDTVLSILAQRRSVGIGVLDFGLAPDQRAWLADRVTHLVRPGWDLDFPDRERTPETRKAQLSRPFLRRHFPGYATYLWIDADAWLQDWRAIELYVAAAGHDKLAITPEIDRSYKRHYKRPKVFGWTLSWKCYREAFGWRVADRLGRNPIVNCGVFALHHDAPHWEAWQRIIGGRLSNATFRATLDGFVSPDSDELLAPYAQRYFDVVADVWRDWGSDMAQYFAQNAYPSWDVSEEAIAATDAYIERTDPPPALRRLLTEGRDDVARALRCRHRDAQSA